MYAIFPHIVHPQSGFFTNCPRDYTNTPILYTNRVNISTSTSHYPAENVREGGVRVMFCLRRCAGEVREGEVMARNGRGRGEGG
jgi:hypothetical protein